MGFPCILNARPHTPPTKRIRVSSSRVLNKGGGPSSHTEGMDRFAFYCYKVTDSSRGPIEQDCSALLWGRLVAKARAVESGQVNRSLKMSSCRKDLQFCVRCRIAMHHPSYVNEP